ncbi:helix-turn-helix domain-containing protein [Corynebacterium breve]|uniref:Helix-turn-helix domain-containing protein n=1 Tax=Corynebacterium breve TaxID=3049799 RepID=A0ABY8VDP6_9CORY|nr:TetR/AcrR family transcriptional regulator [Corynebacterium breve]WIM67785.1 helix-turn-helix domain-containing protein [Corynebacterium breve]
MNTPARHDATDAILSAAEAEFSEHGFQKTSVAAIANRAGIAVGTVYLAFPSKYELFKAVFSQLQQRRQVDLLNRLDWSDPRTAIGQLIRENIAATASNRVLAEWHSEKIGPQLRADMGAGDLWRFEELFQQWHDAGLLAPTVDTAMLADLLEVARVVDQAAISSPATFEFLVEAVVDKLFV